jgi:hypothetical protein
MARAVSRAGESNQPSQRAPSTSYFFPQLFNTYGWMRALLSTEMKYHIVSIPPSFLQDPCASRLADECSPISSRREANGEGDSCAAADCLDVEVETSRWKPVSLSRALSKPYNSFQNRFSIYFDALRPAFIMLLLLLPEQWRQEKGAALSWKSHLVSCKAVTAWQSRLSALSDFRLRMNSRPCPALTSLAEGRINTGEAYAYS